MNAADVQGPAQQPQRRTYTVPEAAAELGVSERLLRKEIAAGRLPVVRIGRRVLISRALIAQIMAVGEQGDAPGVAARLVAVK